MKLSVTGLTRFLFEAMLKQNVPPYLVDPMLLVRHCADEHPQVRSKVQDQFLLEYALEMDLPSKNDQRLLIMSSRPSRRQNL